MIEGRGFRTPPLVTQFHDSTTIVFNEEHREAQ
jgi:hypothetical protein